MKLQFDANQEYQKKAVGIKGVKYLFLQFAIGDGWQCLSGRAGCARHGDFLLFVNSPPTTFFFVPLRGDSFLRNPRNMRFIFSNFSASGFACFNIFFGILIMLENGWFFAELRPKLSKTVNFLRPFFRCL